MEGPLPALLERELATRPPGALCVAYSGGPDSTALLHALSELPEARARGLRAIHVNHGLQAPSDAWQAHCQAFCAARGIPFSCLRVRVLRHGRGLEEAARAARYTALAGALQAGEILLTAHHQDDQAETVLLKLLRGSGAQGLAGMRPWRPFAAGCLWRPLLALPRAAIQDYLTRQQLAVVTDPSNASPAFARNFLRHDVLPRLTAHWPRLGRSMAHSARLMQDVDNYLQGQAAAALDALQGATPDTLHAAGWRALHPALRGLVLERWLHALGLPAPGLAQQAQLLRQLDTAGADRVPLVQWPGCAIRLWRGLLYGHAPLPARPQPTSQAWDGTALTLADGSRLALEPAPSETLGWTVRTGVRGLALRPVHSPHTRKLRILFQEVGLPPWRRPFCPLIYADDDTLLAVADLWQTDAGAAALQALGARLRWTAPRSTITLAGTQP